MEKQNKEFVQNIHKYLYKFKRCKKEIYPFDYILFFFSIVAIVSALTLLQVFVIIGSLLFIYYLIVDIDNVSRTLLIFSSFGVMASNLDGFILFSIMGIGNIIGKDIRMIREMKKEKLEEKKRRSEERRKRLEEEKHQKEEEKKRQIEEIFRKKQEAKGLEKYKGEWYKKTEVRRMKELDLGISEDFMNMNHFEFEEFIAKLFRKMGYDAHVTPKTGDYGIDVIAKKNGEIIAIQVKKHKEGNPIGNRVVIETLGSMRYHNANHSIIVTNRHYTIQAREQAKNAPIELWDGDYLKKMIKKYML